MKMWDIICGTKCCALCYNAKSPMFSDRLLNSGQTPLFFNSSRQGQVLGLMLCSLLGYCIIPLVRLALHTVIVQIFSTVDISNNQSIYVSSYL